MRSLLHRTGWSLLKQIKVKQFPLVLQREATLKAIRCLFSMPEHSWQRRDNTRSATQALGNSIRCYSSDPPKYWDDVKNLPRFHPDKGELVYIGTLAFMVKGVKAFSVSTSLIALGLQPYLISHASYQATGAVVVVGAMMGFFIFATPLLIHFITKKYVTDMYYNAATDEFTATTYNLLVQRKQWKFRPEDVSVPAVPGMFTTVLVKGRPLFLDPGLFSSKKAYIKMMGYDKPLDWEIPSENEEAEQENRRR